MNLLLIYALAGWCICVTAALIAQDDFNKKVLKFTEQAGGIWKKQEELNDTVFKTICVLDDRLTNSTGDIHSKEID